MACFKMFHSSFKKQVIKNKITAISIALILAQYFSSLCEEETGCQGSTFHISALRKHLGLVPATLEVH